MHYLVKLCQSKGVGRRASEELHRELSGTKDALSSYRTSMEEVTS